MNFQISIFGVIIIGFYSMVVLAVVALPLSKLLEAFHWKWIVIAPPVAALLALPWAEEAWIAWHFNEACKEAGVHVIRRVEVPGFYDSTMRSGYELIRDHGYLFMEQDADTSRKIEHIEQTGDRWKVELLDHPTARYHYKYAYQPTPHRYEEPIGWKLERMETQVVDSGTGEVIGRNTLIKRRSSVAEKLWIGLLGSDLVMCPDPEKGPRQPPFPEAVLLPVTKK